MMETLLKLSALNAACYPMKCNNNQVQMPKDSCTYLENNTIYLSPCETGYTCQIGFDTSYCIPTVSSPTLLSYPGEPCTSDSDCKYGICQYGYCQGQLKGQSCSLSAQCAPGLFCQLGSCTALLAVGAGPCSLDVECQNSAGCLDGVCTTYFSLASGTPVSKCGLQFSEFCQTATCWQGTCIDALTSHNPLPVKCNSYQDCTSNLTANGAVFFSDCICGYNNQGTSYCGLFSGDNNYALYISSLSNWLSSEVSGLCNTVRRFDYACIQMFWDKPNSQELLLYYFKSYHYPFLLQNDECIMDIFNADYWGLITEITFSRYFWLGISFYLTIF